MSEPDYVEIIEEMRSRLAATPVELRRSWLGLFFGRQPKDRIAAFGSIWNSPDTGHRDLIRHGRVVWGAVVMANTGLHQPGTINLPALIVFGDTGETDARAASLRRTATRLMELRYGKLPEGDLAAFARVVRNDMSRARRVEVPALYSHGSRLLVSVLDIWRSALPRGMLVPLPLPLVICPERTPDALVLPSTFWPRPFLELWHEGTRERAPRDGAPAAVVVQSADIRRYRENPVTLDDRAAEQILSLLRADPTLRRAYVKVRTERAGWGSLAYSMDITLARIDPARQIETTSRGVRIVVDTECAGDLAGTSIGWGSSDGQAGFVFSNPNERSH